VTRRSKVYLLQLFIYNLAVTEPRRYLTDIHKANTKIEATGNLLKLKTSIESYNSPQKCSSYPCIRTPHTVNILAVTFICLRPFEIYRLPSIHSRSFKEPGMGITSNVFFVLSHCWELQHFANLYNTKRMHENAIPSGQSR
jgi:hypothetical protein